jgi:hypothetical protein
MCGMRCHSSVAALVILGLTLSSAHAAKLKGFYAGSGGISQEVHRTVMLEFAADGTAILEQKWQGKDTQTFHAHWKQERKQVTLTFDPARHNPVPQPLVFRVKGNQLTPTSWDPVALGPIAPPALAPFGGDNAQVYSLANCQSLNSVDPTRDCVTWSSNR